MTELKQQTEKENFASRWSRRKHRIKQQQDVIDERGEKAADELAETGTNTEQQRRDSPEQVRAEKLARLNALKDGDMPDIASLKDDSDFSQFMSVNVSEGLRKLALHKLFHGKAYNIRDGLDEYDGDYTSFEKLDPGTITADMKYRLELEAEKLKAQLEMDESNEPEIEVLADDEVSEPQDELDGEQQQAGIETRADADSGDKAQAIDEQGDLQSDVDQAGPESLEGERADKQINRKPGGEKQT